jgi:hypothetical protein
MSKEMLVSSDETLLRLPSRLAVYTQLHPNLTKVTSEDYVQFIQKLTQLHICGIIRKTELETTVFHYLIEQAK